ncbi:MAG TPA: sulfite oxidase [Verrucomicrobiaceae bacterium]|jgi:DMSO/TMAO reductase YedYZ molybdopterin-dependent catalytic subunit
MKSNHKRSVGHASATGQASFPGLIIRDKEPENLEFPFAALDGFVTNNDQFFVRSHFPVPKIDGDVWRLVVEGQVERPLELSRGDLLKMETRSVMATIECAGNGRIFLSPKVDGLQWELGAVGNAEWTGVPLSSVLEKAGLRTGAVEVVFEGADCGKLAKPPSPGNIQFANSIPVTKALHADVLLAHTMNGEPLTPSHGFPLRAVVPGWYGMVSVKWLSRIVVTDRPFRGYFKSADYTYWEKRDDLPMQLLPVTEVEVKAQISRPVMREIVPANENYRVYGAAWTGESEVSLVEVSTDGGANWHAANFLGDPQRFTWRFWEYRWRTPAQPGKHVLLARATDSRGRIQPMQRDSHRGSYVVSHVMPIEVEVSSKVPPGSTDSFAI